MKDGKLKTNAALMPSSLAELGERINQAMGKMTAGAAASVPWRVQRVRLSNGQTVPVIVKKENHMFLGCSWESWERQRFWKFEGIPEHFSYGFERE
ncbi:hypothetical protein ACFVQB_23835 [Paenibacillus sp. NPDC057886]|uniref:hypothetical protein n=1 Tax=Paenibacillus sp. NPDC057886 TaxID=3346270 RepID=UPI003686960B